MNRAGPPISESEYTIGRGDPPDPDEAPEEYRGPKAVVPHGVDASDIERRRMLGGLLKPVAPIGEIMEAQNQLRQVIHETLKEGRDYGKVPGIEKPFLHKPGAERINVAFGIAPRFTLIDSEIDHETTREWTKRKKIWLDGQGGREFRWEEESGESRGLYRFSFNCQLIDRATGIEVGQGVGSCSSLESKYCDRPQDSENTILKMAKKRAYVDATLTTFGLSDEFTQDDDYVKGDGEKSGGGGAPKAFDPDAKIGIGKHGELTFREACEKEPSYVEWACGRSDGKGMNKLGAPARKAWGALLDEVQGKIATGERARAEHKPDPGAPATIEPLNAVVMIGKHRGVTWGDLIKRDRQYVEQAIEKGWAKLDKPESADLVRALRDELSASRAFDDEAARATAETDQAGGSRLPIGAPPGPHETRFHAAMKAAGVNVDRWKVIGEAHDKLPDHPTDWLEDHYRIALLSIDQFGVQNTLDRCDRRLRNAGRRAAPAPAPPVEREAPPRIDAKLREKALQMAKSAERNRVVDWDKFADTIERLLEEDNADDLAIVLDDLQAQIFKAAGTKAPKQGDLLS